MYAKTHTYFEHLCLDWLLRLDWGETRQQGRNLPRYRAEMIQVPTTRSPSHLLLRRQEIDRRCRWEQLRTGKAHRRLVRRQRGRAQRQRLAPTSSGPDHPTAAAGLRQKTITTIDATPDDGAEVTVVGTAVLHSMDLTVAVTRAATRVNCLQIYWLFRCISSCWYCVSIFDAMRRNFRSFDIRRH